MSQSLRGESVSVSVSRPDARSQDAGRSFRMTAIALAVIVIAATAPYMPTVTKIAGAYGVPLEELSEEE